MVPGSRSRGSGAMTAAVSPRSKGYLAQLVCYSVALSVAASTIRVVPLEPLWAALVADIVATLVVFGFSVALKNSSMYDPYWSVAPPALFAYWLTVGQASPRALVAGALVLLWGARLTWNFLRGFSSLSHQDWRYIDLHEKHGALYWPVSFIGIHMMPTLLTFAGSVPLFVVLTHPERPLGVLDAVAAIVTLLGIGYEATSDEQLRAYVKSGPPKEEWLRTGLWRHSRHPNYFGEVTYWWGLSLFAFAAAPAAWWYVLGAASVLSLFFFVSIPIIDERMKRRRPGYEAYAKRVSRLVPWFVRD